MDAKLKECIEAVSRVVTEEGIAVYFQPLISLESKSVIGFEAFSRGVDREGNTVANPGDLFNEHLPLTAQHRVEMLCLKKSIESFVPINDNYKEMLLFLNVNSTVYNSPEMPGISPASALKGLEFNPRICVFEFDVAQLKKAVPIKIIRELQDQGYRISLDNIDGSPQSREMLSRIRPDFAKFGQTFFQGVESSRFKNKMVRSAATCLKEAETIAVAKGVENEAEALALAEAGIILQQGFLYSDTVEDGDKESFQEKVSRINSLYKGYNRKRVKVCQETFRNFHLLLKGNMTKMQQEDMEGINWHLEELARKTPGLVSAYVLDSSGKQLSKRVLGQAGDFIGKHIEPSSIGSDHSHEDYFMYLNSGFEKTAGSRGHTYYCRDNVRYLAGFFYQGGRRGSILVLEYADRSGK